MEWVILYGSSHLLSSFPLACFLRVVFLPYSVCGLFLVSAEQSELFLVQNTAELLFVPLRL